MLTCVYHPLDKMRIVEDDEATRLKATGAWFDCPKKAREYREKVAEEIEHDQKPVVRTQKQRGTK